VLAFDTFPGSNASNFTGAANGSSKKAEPYGPLAPASFKKAMAEETDFRVGACHAALWFHDEVKRMVAEGKTAPEMSERLAALVHVLLDWSGQQVEMPNGKTPWEWDQADLEPYILRRKTEW